MASTPKKTLPGAAHAGRNSPAPQRSASPSPSPAKRSGTGAAPLTTGNGVAKTRSVRTPNGTPRGGAVKKPMGSSDLKNSASADQDAIVDEEARLESSALMEELRQKLQAAETRSEDFQKQVEVLQSRLDEAISEQGKLEDRLHEEEEKLEALDNDKREAVRQKNQLETIYEAERAAAMKERESVQAKEEEMQGVIHRLKESLSQKDSKEAPDGRSSRKESPSTLEPGFAPPSTLQRANSRNNSNNSKLLLQKDQMIESLRLELAEVQIKLLEIENMSDASRRVQELERTVLEQRMTNARLMEDFDSYQLLLSERTLNGDFSHNDLLRSSPPRAAHDPQRQASLADELSTADTVDDDDAAPNDNIQVKSLKAEISSLKDSNKALTLYITKIIDRIMQHQGGYENILSNADDDAPVPAGAWRTRAGNRDKDLPPPPPPKENTAPSLLQRASSVLYGPTEKRPRPQSTYTAPAHYKEPGVTENPDTAPSIPLSRSHAKRTSNNADLASKRRSTQLDYNVGAVVNNMYRGPSGEQAPTSPGVISPRNSINFFSRNPSASNTPAVGSIREDGTLDGLSDSESEARRSALDALTGATEFPIRTSSRGREVSGATLTSEARPGSGDTPSPPRSVASTNRDRERESGGPGVMTGNKMRPLRLVKEEEERRGGQRSSWMPASVGKNLSEWWNKDKEGGGAG